MQVGRLEIELLANVARLSRDMERARGITGGAMDQIERRVQMMARTVAVSAAAAGAAMLAWTNNIARAGAEINRLSQVSGATATEFQRYAYAARTAGIEQGKLADIFKDMQDRVGDFLQTGGGPLADFFENIAPKVGVTIEQFRTLSGPQALGLFVQSLEKANLSQSEMTFYMEAIASDSTMLLPLLKNNAAALKTLGDEAARVGAIMNDQTVQAAVQMEQNLERLQSMVSALSISIANQFLPTLNSFISNVISAATETDGLQTEVNDLAKNESLKTFLNDALVGLARVADVAVFAAKSVGVVGSAFVAAKADIEAFLAFVGRPDALSKAIAPEESARLEAEYQAAQQARIDATETFNKRLDDLLTYQGNRFEQAALQAIKTQQETAGAIKVVSDVVKTIDLTAGPTAEQMAALKKWMEQLATPGEKLASILEKAKTELGELYTPEIEKRIIAMYGKQAKGLQDSTKAMSQFEQQRRTYLRSQYQEISNLSDQADALEDQVRYYGLSESALNDLTIARLREQQAALQGFDGAEEEIAILQRMIEQYQRIGMAMLGLEQKEAEKAAWESWSRDVETIFDQVGQSLTDAIFEGGKSGRELVKDLFKTLTLRVLINPVMNSIQGAVTNSLGGMFGMQNPQQGGVMGTVSNLGSAYNAASGGLTGNISNVANWVGEKAGSTALQSFASGLSATFGFSAPVAATGGVASLAGVTAGPGLAASLGSGASGVIGGSAAGIGSAIGAALPWVGGALAIGSLLGGGDLFGGGPPKTRHGQRTTAELAGGSYGITSTDDRMPAGTDAAVLTMAQAGVDMANELFRRVGVDAAIDSFYAIAESSVLGDRNGVASGGVLRTGDQTRAFGIPQASDMTLAGVGGWSEAETLPRLQTDIQLSILEAFQTQVDSLPDVLADMIRGVDVRALDAAGAQDLAARFSAVVEGASSFLQLVQTMPFDQLRDLSFDAAAGLVEVAGGLQNLTGNLNTYYAEFHTEAERNANTLRNVAKALEEVGVALPDTRAQFRALVEAQDLTTDAGRRVYAALLNVSGAFASVTQSAEQAAEDQKRIAAQNKQTVIDDLQTAYNDLVNAGQAEIARLQQTFGETDSAMNSYRSAVQALESEFGSLFSSIDRYISDLRGSVDASAQAQYRQARAVISTALATGQLPQTADLTEALQVAQRGVTSQAYGSLFEQNRAYAIFANEMEALKAIAEPELDAAKATLAQLEEQYALLRGTNRIAGDSLSALEQQVRLAFATEEAARHEISLVEQQLELARQQHEKLMEALTGIDGGIKSLAEAMAAFAAAAAAAKQAVPGGGGGTGGWTPGNLPAGAENLTAAERYVLYNTDLLQDQAGSGMSVEQYAQYHWNTYGQHEDRDIRYRAAGGYTPPGLTWVGEEGPELVNFRQPGMVYTAAQSANLAGGGSELAEEVRQLREENRRMNAYLYQITKNTKRTEQHTEYLERGAMGEGAVVVY